MSFSAVPGGAPPADDHALQLSDLRRYDGDAVRRLVSTAGAADQPTSRALLAAHLGGRASDLQRALEDLLDTLHRTTRAVLGYRGE